MDVEEIAAIDSIKGQKVRNSRVFLLKHCLFLSAEKAKRGEHGVSSFSLFRVLKIS